MGKWLALMICCFFLSGCATTRGSANSEMQSRIDSLENELQTKNQQIESMEIELNQAKQRTAAKQDYSNIVIKRSIKQPAPAKTENDQGDDAIKVSGVTGTQVQQALKKAGYYKGTVDGKIGPKTKQAIRAFQRDNGLKADGVIGKSTWAKLK